MRLAEIREAVQDGATEIDIVINRTMAIGGDWKGVYDEVRLMKEACGEAHMKTILATGELGSMVNVYRASMVGFKPAGGIRTAKDVCTWLVLMKEELGDEWTKPDLFRIGASSLLGDIERQLFHHVTGRYAAPWEVPMA
nr:hypothetical protein BaRGS_013758 [Batillaria attramentaria]